MKKYYAVIDTNVIVSSMLKRDSIPGGIVQFCEVGIIIPLYDDRIISEYRMVLSREKFHLTDDIVKTFLESFVSKGIKINADKIDIEMTDVNDKIFYEVVMEQRKNQNSYLITGNIKHFPHEKFILTPREMLDIIINDNIN